MTDDATTDDPFTEGFEEIVTARVGAGAELNDLEAGTTRAVHAGPPDCGSFPAHPIWAA